MATVTLDKIWLNLASDPTDYLAFQNAAELKFAKTRDGEVRPLANGRIRAVLRAGVTREYELRLDLCTRAEVEWLEDHVASLVCVRDDRGRKFYATYLGLGAEELTVRNDYANVSIKLAETTHSEEV